LPDYNLGTAHGSIEIDTSGLDRAGRNLNSAGRQMLAFGGILTGGFVTAVKTSAEFEKEISAIQAVTASTDEEVDVLRRAALDLGSQGPFGPTAVAQAFVELAKAGLTATEIIEGAGTATINLAKAGDIDIARAAEIAANSMRTFGIRAEDVNGVVDTLAGAANQSTLDVEDLAVSMRYTGGVAAALQIPIEEVATALALLGNAGIKGSTGGTSLRRVLLNMSPDSKEARKELEKLGIITADGANQFFNARGEAKSLSTIFTILRDATADLTDEQKINSINTIFGARASAAALILMEQAGQGFVDMDAAIGKTDAATVAAERLDNLAGSMRRLKAAVEAYLVDAGGPFQKTLKGMVDWLTRFVNKMAEGDSKWTRWILLGSLFLGIFFLITGAITLAVGSVLRFANAVSVLAKAVLFLNRALLTMMSWLVVHPIVLIIVAVIALAIALYLLYKRNEGFRKFVDNLWQSMQKAWDKILPIFQAVGRAMLWVGRTVKDAWDASYPTLVRIGKILREIAEVVYTVFLRVKDFLVRAAEITKEVALRIGKAVTDIIDFFRDLPGNVRRHLNTAFDAVVNFFQSLPSLALQGLQALGRVILAGLAKLPYLFGYIIGFIIGFFIGMNLRLLQLAFQLFLDLGRLFLEGLQKLAGLVLEGLGWLVSHAIQFAIDFPSNLLSFLGTLLELFLTAMNKLISAMASWALDMVTKALSFSVDFGEGIMRELPKLPGRIASILVEVLTKVSGWVTDMIALAAELGLKFLGKVWDEFKQLPQTIINAIKSLFDIKNLLVEIGEDIIRGLIKGVKNMAGAVKDAVGDVVNGIKNGFKSGFGLWSPSRVTTEYGMFLGQGLVKGMQDERKNLVRLIGTMEKDIGSLTSVQRSLNSSVNIGSLLPVRNTGVKPVTVQSGNTINTTINNPIGEASEESLFITAQKLEYLGVF
jgi:TP901 family phage tail tape measure protein